LLDYDEQSAGMQARPILKFSNGPINHLSNRMERPIRIRIASQSWQIVWTGGGRLLKSKLRGWND